MTRTIILTVLLALLLTSGCAPAGAVPETTAAPRAATVPATAETVPAATTVETTASTVPAEPVYVFTAEEEEMLLKIGMAELGNGGCTECVALVMRTILNRVESGRFGSSIRSVLFAQDQFTPVMDGTYYDAKPNELCREALDMVISGWDESQGALYYEFCEGESWHSRNLNLLLQHCDTRFYD